jgi:hypothetical protein
MDFGYIGSEAPEGARSGGAMAVWRAVVIGAAVLVCFWLVEVNKRRRRLNWATLPADPAVLSAFIHNIGVKAWHFVDVYGLDEAALDLVPKPCVALILVIDN